MDKQTYEELKDAMWKVIHDYEMNYIHLRHELGHDLKRKNTDHLDLIENFIESQKPLEIVEDAYYISIREVLAIHGKYHFVIKKGTKFKLTSIGSDLMGYRAGILGKVYIIKHQFNQHNFMKVEDK